MCREAPRAVLELESYGLPFSRTETGDRYFINQSHDPQEKFINEHLVVSL